VQVLGLLLSDGALRDAVATDPGAALRRAGAREKDLPMLMALPLSDLERQAVVLIRKRFEEARRCIPLTCHRLGPGAWQRFRSHARSRRLDATIPSWVEALDFCRHLESRRTGTVSRREWNRLRFLECGAWFRLRVGWDRLQAPDRALGLQVLVAAGRGRCHDWWLWLGL
jgi:hypothetical protein